MHYSLRWDSSSFSETEFTYELLKQILICSMSKKTPGFNNKLLLSPFFKMNLFYNYFSLKF